MARTIEQIEKSITERLKVSFTLSTSAASEWRLWVHCMAYGIYLFEIVLDTFKKEMDEDAEKEVAGTVTWYNDKCYEFQMGHELVFDTVTGLLEYPTVTSWSISTVTPRRLHNKSPVYRTAWRA